MFGIFQCNCGHDFTLVRKFDRIAHKVQQHLAQARRITDKGFGHIRRNTVGQIQTFFMGLIFGAFYLRTSRNLWVTIIAHGLGNTIRFLFFFIGAA